MPSESKGGLTTQTEKPNHYSYLKEFRVEQCPLFLQHKCTQHRPFTCFHWHFNNQRRRRPIRKRDATFNYSPDVYCTEYDETTGICPKGDECPLLHRTAGDTERRYHLRYYKTCRCMYDTDSRGFCVKNGPHCAFAHGVHDERPAVYDAKELQNVDTIDHDGSSLSNGPNVLDKERNLMNEDPKWQDTNFVLANYKTEPCKRPPRLCRQGYACPQYHNNRDKRRSPRKYKYRSTPCPNVKHGDEWGEPSNCENGDACQYCHSRTEQQFHPEIYKSTKCNDVQQTGYCPRGAFCAFAHVDQEMVTARDIPVPPDSGTNLADILSNALPPEPLGSQKMEERSSESSSNNGHGTNNGDQTESTSTSSTPSINKAPGSHLMHVSSVNSNNSNTPSSSPSSIDESTPSSLSSLPTPIAKPRPQNATPGLSLLAGLTRCEAQATYQKAPGIEREERERKHSLFGNGSPSCSSLLSSSMASGVSPLATPFYPACDTVESVVGNALDDLNLDEPLNLAASLDKDLENDANPVSSSLTAQFASSGLLSSAPVNIPGSALNDRNPLNSFSPTSTSSLHPLTSNFLSAPGFSRQDSLDTAAAFLNQSRMAVNSNSVKIGSFPCAAGSLYDFTSQNMSPGNRTPLPGNPSPLVGPFSPINSSLGSASLSEIQRLRDELSANRLKLASWEEGIAQARSACEAWRREADSASRNARMTEQKKDDAIAKLNSLQLEIEQLQGGPYLHVLRRVNELQNLPLSTLKSLKTQLRSDLEEIDKVLSYQTANKCLVCEENTRSVAVLPCNHYVLCGTCASVQNECPYCSTQIVQRSVVPPL